MKKWLSISTALIMLLVIMAGCSSKDATETPAAASAPAATAGATAAATEAPAVTAEPAAAPIEITYWGDWGGEGQKQFETMTEAFNKSQSKIHVTYVLQEDMVTKFLTAASSGGSPDIMFWDRWRTSLYASKNVIHPIDEYMKKDNINAADFYDEALKEMTAGGKLYGLPLTVDARALFYNKKMFADKGITPPTNWPELQEAAKKLTVWDGKKLVVSGLSMQDTGLFNMWLQQAGGTMLTDDLTKTNFNNEKGKQVLDFWDQLINKDKVYKVGFESGLGEGTDAFATGKVAMLYTGPWNISTYKKFGKDLDFGIVPAPAGPNGDKGSVMGGFSLVIPEGSKNKEAAWEFEKWWLAQPENALLYAKTSMNLPGNKNAIQDPFFKDDPFWKPILDSLEFAKIRPQHPGYSVMEGDGLQANLDLFLQGKQDAATTLKKAQEQGDKLLEQNAAGK
ncbi:ABC transporter substrate-binding protein [Paenibacillus psychroresistens]|uniref:ABC transporter substrate-binding protein n=1 Tax=Paenibacillus psychroresistens TaxID=1778678 RepID=A0A6B8RJV7_9BACL|nr:ABC transporter substrate-binding protein [Paenibacillus psychroresistens]QGQ95618.1 ABC transporter substrate-binding protein [Paenibacillus psychroresistens]